MHTCRTNPRYLSTLSVAQLVTQFRAIGLRDHPSLHDGMIPEPAATLVWAELNMPVKENTHDRL